MSPENKSVPPNFSYGDKLSPSDQILAQTLPLLKIDLRWSDELDKERSETFFRESKVIKNG